MRKMLHITGCVGMALLTGCSTISVTPQSRIVEGPMIPGSEYYEVPGVNIVRQADGLNEKFTLDADQIYRCYKVTQTEEKWNEVQRKRYLAVVGVHEDYRLWVDLGEPFFAIGAAFAGCIVPPLVLLSPPNPFENLPKAIKVDTCLAGVVVAAALPGVSCCSNLVTAIDYSMGKGPAPRAETVEKNVMLTPLPPKQKKEVCSDQKKVNLAVAVRNEQGKLVKQTSSFPGGSLSLGLDTLLSDDANTNLTFQISSQEPVRLTGEKKQFAFSYKTEDLVRRLLAAKPDPSAYAPVGLALSSPQIDDRENGNGDGKLQAGEQGSITLTVANSGSSDGYLVCAESMSCSGDIQLYKSDETALLRSGKSARVFVPFSIPLKAPDGEETVRFIAKDALGRQSSPLSVRLPYTHRDLPELLISSVKLSRIPNERDLYSLEVNIRNRGAGAAEKVKVAVSGLPLSAQLLDKEVFADEIGALSRKTVFIKVRIPGNEPARNLKLNLAASERLAVGNTAREVELLLPD